MSLIKNSIGTISVLSFKTLWKRQKGRRCAVGMAPSYEQLEPASAIELAKAMFENIYERVQLKVFDALWHGEHLGMVKKNARLVTKPKLVQPSFLNESEGSDSSPQAHSGSPRANLRREEASNSKDEETRRSIARRRIFKIRKFKQSPGSTPARRSSIFARSKF